MRHTEGPMEQSNNIRVCLLGTHSECPGSENTVCGVLAHLHCEHGGQPTHCPDCGVHPNLGCPYVFLSWLLITYGSCLFYSHLKFDHKLTL